MSKVFSLLLFLLLSTNVLTLKEYQVTNTYCVEFYFEFKCFLSMDCIALGFDNNGTWDTVPCSKVKSCIVWTDL